MYFYLGKNAVRSIFTCTNYCNEDFVWRQFGACVFRASASVGAFFNLQINMKSGGMVFLFCKLKTVLIKNLWR